MTQPAIRLTVYHLGDLLLVVPWALSETGFKALHNLIQVEPGSDGLLRALQDGERIARAATDLPLDRRFPDGPPYWRQAGCSSFAEFVKGAISVAIVRDEELTEVGYRIPNAEGDAFVPADDVDDLALGPGTPMTEVAETVLQAFEAAQKRGR